MNLAENIKAVAGRHGKTISQLASEMGVAQSSLSRTINNERISLKDMCTIAEKIGCSVSDFLHDENTIICPHCGKPIKISVG